MAPSVAWSCFRRDIDQSQRTWTPGRSSATWKVWSPVKLSGHRSFHVVPHGPAPPASHLQPHLRPTRSARPTRNTRPHRTGSGGAKKIKKHLLQRRVMNPSMACNDETLGPKQTQTSGTTTCGPPWGPIRNLELRPHPWAPGGLSQSGVEKRGASVGSHGHHTGGLWGWRESVGNNPELYQHRPQTVSKR